MLRGIDSPYSQEPRTREPRPAMATPSLLSLLRGIIARVRGLLPERTMVSLRASGGWGGRYNRFLSSSSFFFLSFRTGDVLVTSGTCSWDVPRGGPHLGSKGLGGGLDGLGRGLGGLGGGLSASLLHCFSASVLHCFIASLLHCFIASLLHCFIAPLLHFFNASSLHCFIASLLDLGSRSWIWILDLDPGSGFWI